MTLKRGRAVRLGAALAAPVAIALACSAGPAHAATSNPTPNSIVTAVEHYSLINQSSVTSAGETVGCWFRGNTPFELVKGRTLYGEGLITSCTVPRPEECKLEVELESYRETVHGSGWTRLNQPKSTGWIPCTPGKTVTSSYRCHSNSINTYLRTLTFLTIIWNGRTAANYHVSPTIFRACE